MKKLEDEAISINLPQSAEDSVSQQTRIKISIKDDDFESFGDDNSGFDNDSCDFRSCGTRDDGDDDDDISLSPSNRVILNERLHSLSQLRENNSAPIIRRETINERDLFDPFNQINILSD